MLLWRSFLYALVFVLVSVIADFLATRSLGRDLFVLLMFLEGGIGLMAGVGIALSNSPSVARTGEVLFNTAPWSPEGERHAQKIALGWITTSVFIVLIGVVASAI